VVLAGLIVPALIMVFYILWVLHTAKKASYKHASLEASYFCTKSLPQDGNAWSYLQFHSSTRRFQRTGAVMDFHFGDTRSVTLGTALSPSFPQGQCCKNH
jgi:hypothetical protein